jgi:ribosome assembly protein 1
MSSVFLPPDETRLVTICAHVDHGKTTLADNLIESNGIISERHAGTLRYLDSTEEEQRRGITMRASAIGLRHRYTPSNAGAAKKQQEQQQQQHQEGGSSSSSSSPSPSSPSPIIVHLLDSPGHTDFSTEVSSSLQCCDGCLLVVDAVEGMCARTHQVVREAHSHQLVPILIINKVDRLCTDLCLTPTEAYIRLRSLIESVNAACAAMLVSKRAKRREDERVLNKKSGLLSKGDSNNWTFDAQRGNVVFASALFGWGFTVPSLARSLFRNKILPIKPIMLKQYLFGDFYFKQQSSNASNNSNTDSSNTGKMMKLKVTVENQNQQPLFAEYGLQPLWEIYEGVAAAAASCGLGSNIFSDGRIPATTTFNNKSKGKIEIKATTPGMDQVLQAIQAGSTMPESATSAADISSLDNLQQIMTRTGSSTSEEAVLRSLLRRYRPLSDIVLNSVYEICPSPIEAAEDVRPRALALVDPMENEDDKKNDDDDEEKEKELVGSADENNCEEEFRQVKEAVRSCDVSIDAPAVAYVCKFMAADRSQIRDPGRIEDEDDETSSTVILGLARVLSGRLKTSSTYHVMGPKHKFNDPNIIRSRPIRLFLLMGSSFVLVDEVPAGHLCAIQNLEDVQYKTATISDSSYGMPLLGFSDMIQRPLVKVNVEAIDPADTYTLERGLVKLSLADAAVEVTATAKGERIVACLGELHLEQSILDLQNIYCDKKGVQLRISEPIVEFGETTAWFDDNELDFEGFLSESRKQVPPLRQLTIPPYNEEEGIEFSQRGRARSIVSGRVGAVSMRVVPLDPMIYEALKGGDVNEDCSDAIDKLGRALGFPKDQNAESILKALADTVISIDDSGNAIVASSALESGTTVAGVISGKDEIYVPNKLGFGASVESVEEDNDESKTDVCGLLEYETVQREIRDNGFLLNDAEKRTITSVDTAALEIWRNQMKGSLIAGFQMAMRAGPICEEPVRSVLVILEGLEVALKEDKRSENEFKTASPLSGGMMAAALRIGIRSALL